LPFPARAARRRQGRGLGEEQRLQAGRLPVAPGDGWHRSTWDERTPIHVGENKVHLKVKFSRWRMIGTFETIYIVMRLDGRWDIQARSSFAS
jgi:hypothetical protein